MKIYLFYIDKLYTFILPKEVEGSFSFDIDKNETSKLINVEAREGKWVIFSVDGVQLYQGNSVIPNMLLTNDTFYIIGKNEKKYLIYAKDISTDKLTTYNYTNLSMIIGNSQNSNIKYNCPYLNQIEIKIIKQDNNYVLQQSQPGITYVNNVNMLTTSCYLKNGDSLNIFGLKIYILNNLILINNPGGNVTVSPSSGLVVYQSLIEDAEKDFPIQDRELYDKKDYFSKSPRIRRIIETKEINLTPPPQNNNNGEVPMIMTIAPMILMGMTSLATTIQTFTRLGAGETTLKQCWPQLVMAFGMLSSMLIWPIVMNIYNKKQKKKQRAELIEKYDNYLAKKEKEVQEEVHLQRDILIDNLITVNDCLNIINKRNVGFWDKRTDQNDFLVTRFGMGRQPLDIEIKYQEQDFSIDEDELRERADNMVERYKFINNVPVSYSFYDNKITAIMGFDKRKTYGFLNNILLQLLTFYSYEDLKLVVITNEDNKEKFEYIKYLNHNFNNERTFRFFASNQDSVKSVMNYLHNILLSRTDRKNNDDKPDRPYYLIIIDDYDMVKRFDFIKEVTELDEDNRGFSLLILENRMNKLPSKCSNFISLANDSGSILKNSYEKQEQITFKDEINYNIDMMEIAKIMSNIPIEFEEGVSNLPDTVNFLEMYGVGKVEQLNVLNRWNTNDSTVSLKAEIGMDEQDDPMYLDLHEKYHGPHGLIAGTTGSGKSEFIISYILSMCINYSPDDIAFILIDYKGGGLALAFENRSSGIILPHLAGTITNLDKAEMDRTLVSIDSEVKRRQEMFNEARDILNESTIDIYKYQRFYKEGRLKEPIPHLFIICDEFAELKAQQPDFMDNLISVARIGRSLGVHLILATQKPSGVVNDQIWSNTRFRVCLKVQDESDSKEMLKKPDAAHITQAGRYYLQVGYDEVYALGQSGYSGAKYYPSNKIVKQVDKSINFINDFGQPIKSIQALSGNKTEAQGEQLQAVMKLIIDVSNMINKKTRRLWLPNIPDTIIIDEIEKRYNFVKEDYHPKVIIGEYDAPEKQEQGQVIYDLLEDGNTAIYGNDGSEREMLLSTIIYGLSKNYTAEEINIYSIDYGSESLRRFQALPQVGGIAFQGDDEEYNNLIKMLKEEISNRKKLFVDYGGEYKSYIKKAAEKLPVILVIINNFDSIKDSIPSSYDEYTGMVRDSERYGIIFILTADAGNSIHNKLSQNLPNIYAFKLKEQYDYIALFNAKTKITPRDIFGRGILNNEGTHEFQTAKIIEDESKMNDYLQEFITNQKEISSSRAKRIPKLPKVVQFNDIKSSIDDLTKVPIGISKYGLDIKTIDLLNSLGTVITSNKISNTLNFIKSLLVVLKNIAGVNLLIIDSKAALQLSNNEYQNYYINNLDAVTDKIVSYLKELKEKNNNSKTVILIYDINRYLNEIADNKINELVSSAKQLETVSIIAVDDYAKFKNYQFVDWFQKNFDINTGIWIGQGVSEQNLIRLVSMNKEMTKTLKNEMGYLIVENRATLCKLLNFYSDPLTNYDD